MRLSYVALFSLISFSNLFAELSPQALQKILADQSFDDEALFGEDEEIDLSSLFSTHEAMTQEMVPAQDSVIPTLADNQEKTAVQKTLEPPQTSPTPSTSSSTTPMANSPINPRLQNGTGLFSDLEMLVVQAEEDGVPFAYQGQLIDTQHQRNAQTPSFNWNLGFRFALGYELPYDGWDLKLSWMELQNHASGSSQFTDASGYQIWTVVTQILPGTSPYVNASLKIDLDQVDLTFGRAFHLSPHLTLKPVLGLRTDWILQKYNVDFTTSFAQQKARMSQRFFSFGFLGALESNWTFPYGMSLFGNVGMSAGLGFFSILQKGFESDEVIFRIQNSFRTVKPVFDFALGFQWDDPFCKKMTNERFALSLRTAYEYHLYLNQNQFAVSSGSPYLETFAPQKGDLGYQGVSISVLLSF